MSDQQVFKIALSPAQRVSLIQLSHKETAKIPNGAEGRKYRRFCKGFGIKHVGEILRAQEGTLAGKAVTDEKTLYLHEVTIENVEYAIKVLNEEKSAIQEDLLGDLFDTLEDLKSGREYTPPQGLLEFNQEKDRDRWMSDDETDCPYCKETIKKVFQFCPHCGTKQGQKLVSIPATKEEQPVTEN